MHILDTDVLVLGAGLAGLRAAMAALEASPGLRVAVVSSGRGPSGSSFTNRNNALGLLVHEDDAQREAFCMRVQEIAAPGALDTELVRIMAEESQARFREMADLGFSFARDEGGALRRYPACFAPDLPHARIFTDLGQAFRCCNGKLQALGARNLHGYKVRDIVLHSQGGAPRACGAVLEGAGGEILAVRAGAVILALGGPAALFRYNQAPAGNSGCALGLLAKAGADTVNAGYLQFMWSRLPKGDFVAVSALAAPDARIRSPEGKLLPLPEDLAVLAPQRRTHCPMGHGLEDVRLDLFLGRNLAEDGAVDVFLPNTRWSRIAPLAHAGNGGAKIDAHGRTSVPGLFAVGECAGGMHGANRMGGGMILATQVFGRRAGLVAAGEAVEVDRIGMAGFARLARDVLHKGGAVEGEDSRFARRIAHELQRSVIFGDEGERGAMRRELESLQDAELCWEDRLRLESARVLASSLHDEILPQAAPEARAGCAS